MKDGADTKLSMSFSAASAPVSTDDVKEAVDKRRDSTQEVSDVTVALR